MTRQPTYLKDKRASTQTGDRRPTPRPCTGFPLPPESLPAPTSTKDPREHRILRPLDGWGPGESTVETALSYIDSSGIAPRLDALLKHRLGRPRSLPSRVYLLGFYLNALRKGHRGSPLDAARALYAMPDHQKALLHIDSLALDVLHRRVSAWFNDVAAALQDPDDAVDGQGLDAFTVCQQIARSSLTDPYRRWPSTAIDGIALPTFGNMHLSRDRIALEGDATYEENGQVFGGEVGAPPWAPPPEETARARIYGIGVDGRPVYTKDTEARAGYRTATDKHPGGIYVGYEATIGYAMPVMEHTDGVFTARFGPTPPPVCLTFNLAPAGTHRGEATLACVHFLHDNWGPIDEVAADRGITTAVDYLPELRRLGIKSVHTLTEQQRRQRPGPVGGFFRDATLLSDATPPDLLDLPLPPIRASEEVRAPFEADFNRRAQYRWRILAGPDNKGRIRLCCPICTAKVLKCRNVPATMRLPSYRPLVTLPNGRRRCCESGSITYGPTDYPTWMGDVVPFTTAHNLSYGRRNAAETGNSFLHGLYVDIDENWAEPFGTVKRALLLAFTLAAINHYHLTPEGSTPEPGAMR